MYREKTSKSHRKFAILVSIALIATALIIVVPSDSYAQSGIPDHHWIGFNGNQTIYMSTGVGGISKPDSNPTLLQNTSTSSGSDCSYFYP